MKRILLRGSIIIISILIFIEIYKFLFFEKIKVFFFENYNNFDASVYTLLSVRELPLIVSMLILASIKRKINISWILILLSGLIAYIVNRIIFS